MSKIYNKLVRDNIPEVIKSNNEVPITRILSDDEYKKCLDIKLLEEVNEYLKDDNLEEIADVMEVIYSILKYKNIRFNELEKVIKGKREKKGSFDKKIFLEEVK